MKPVILAGATLAVGLTLAVYPITDKENVLTEKEMVAFLTQLYEEQDKVAHTGKYIQILEGGILPEYDNRELSGVAIPDGIQVDVYEGPSGSGYQVIYTTETMIYSYGFGPESVERTYTQPVIKTDRSASST